MYFMPVKVPAKTHTVITFSDPLKGFKHSAEITSQRVQGVPKEDLFVLFEVLRGDLVLSVLNKSASLSELWL